MNLILRAADLVVGRATPIQQVHYHLTVAPEVTQAAVTRLMLHERRMKRWEAACHRVGVRFVRVAHRRAGGYV